MALTKETVIDKIEVLEMGEVGVRTKTKVLEDGTEIESRANRVLLFDPSKPHHSTSCTSDKRRVNININYL